MSSRCKNKMNWVVQTDGRSAFIMYIYDSFNPCTLFLFILTTSYNILSFPTGSVTSK